MNKLFYLFSLIILMGALQGCDNHTPDEKDGWHCFGKWSNPTTNCLGEIHQSRICTNCGYVESRSVLNW